MRAVISFVFAGALFVGGCTLLYLDLTGTSQSRRILAITGVFLLVVGAVWLWADFIKPLLGFSQDEEE